MWNPYSEDDFELLMSMIRDYYRFSDEMPSLFEEHSLEYTTLRNRFRHHKQYMESRRKENNPKEEPIEVNIKSTIKMV